MKSSVVRMPPLRRRCVVAATSLEPIDLDLLHLKLASEVVERGLICAPYAPRHQRLWLHRLDRLLYPDVRGRIVLPRR
jgi:hypothetical protein